MKKIILLLLLVVSSTAIAQEKNDYTSKILVLLKHADNDFKDIMGPRKDDVPDLEATSYESKEIIGVGDESLIKGNESSAAFYMCNAQLAEASTSALMRDVLDLLNKAVQAGIYTGNEYKTADEKNITEIKDKNGYDIMKLVSQYTDDNNFDNDYFLIVIYSASMKINMKAQK